MEVKTAMTTWLPVELKQQLIKEAHALYLSPGAYVRQIIEERKGKESNGPTESIGNSI